MRCLRNDFTSTAILRIKEITATPRKITVVATVDGEPVTAGPMPTGVGGHMLSISAKLRKKLGKELGKAVTVHLTERPS